MSKLVCVVPARCGSKRVPLKNIFPLGGRPLIDYTLDCIEAVKFINPVYVSTDCDEVARVAAARPWAMIHRRNDALSGDTVSTEEVLLEVIETHEKDFGGVDWVMTLPPTNPFRKPSTVIDFLARLRDVGDDIDAILSVSTSKADFWLEHGDVSMIRRLFPKEPRRQQDRTELLEENGVVYLTRVKSLRITGKIFGERTLGIRTDRWESFDLNDSVDFKLAEMIIRLDNPGSCL